jgi:hypothetical protein
MAFSCASHKIEIVESNEKIDFTGVYDYFFVSEQSVLFSYSSLRTDKESRSYSQVLYNVITNKIQIIYDDHFIQYWDPYNEIGHVFNNQKPPVLFVTFEDEKVNLKRREEIQENFEDVLIFTKMFENPFIYNYERGEKKYLSVVSEDTNLLQNYLSLTGSYFVLNMRTSQPYEYTFHNPEFESKYYEFSFRSKNEIAISEKLSVLAENIRFSEPFIQNFEGRGILSINEINQELPEYYILTAGYSAGVRDLVQFNTSKSTFAYIGLNSDDKISLIVGRINEN